MNAEEEKQISLPFFGVPRLFPFLKPYRWRIAFMILLGGLSSVIDALYPLFNRYALDHFIADRTLTGIGVFIALYVCLVLAQAAVNFKSTSDCGSLEVTVNKDLRNAAFNHLQTVVFLLQPEFRRLYPFPRHVGHRADR